ncbi:MAG: sigma-54-dependent Fis family transcriptional regulator, partial [Muribaculaceae bacterium]|nr:sigma-54-dependent Fis family transcriptional regulator [Muribaculaceae bacterium]
PKVTQEAMELLKQQPWPGNIRQLANIVERTLLVTPSSTLDARDFRAQGLTDEKIHIDNSGRIKSREKTEIENALTEAGGNLTRAAALLGITRQTLYRRMAKYNIKLN